MRDNTDIAMARFHERWGWFPMEDWLEAFACQGLAAHYHRRFEK